MVKNTYMFDYFAPFQKKGLHNRAFCENSSIRDIWKGPKYVSEHTCCNETLTKHCTESEVFH